MLSSLVRLQTRLAGTDWKPSAVCSTHCDRRLHGTDAVEDIQSSTANEKAVCPVESSSVLDRLFYTSHYLSQDLLHVEMDWRR